MKPSSGTGPAYVDGQTSQSPTFQDLESAGLDTHVEHSEVLKAKGASLDKVISRIASQSSASDPGPPPDGGFEAWTQVLTAHLTVAVTWGYIQTFGVYWQLFLAQGICTGLGNGLIFCPALSVLSTYFSTRRALAIGIGASGSATGGLIFPALVQQLLPKIGFGWTVRVLGFVMLGLQIIGFVFTKPRLPPRKTGPLIEWSAFRELPYTLFSIGMFLVFWGLYFAFYYVGSFGRDVLGISREESINNLLIMNGVGLIGRLVPAHLADRYFGPLNTLIPFVAVSSLLLFCWAAVADSNGLVAWALLYGLFGAGIQSLFPATLSSLTTDLKKTGVRMGMIFSIVSFASLTGPPLAGALIQDRNGSYLNAQMFAGTVLCCGCLTLIAARLAKTGRKVAARSYRAAIDLPRLSFADSVNSYPQQHITSLVVGREFVTLMSYYLRPSALCRGVCIPSTHHVKSWLDLQLHLIAMDPLSFTASLIAVLGAAKAGCKVLEKVNDSRKAPSEVGDLLEELNRFQALLKDIEGFAGPRENSPGVQQLQDIVRLGGEIVSEINITTAQTWPSIRYLRLSDANRQRVTVFKDGGKLVRLKDRLRVNRLDLTAALSLLTASSSTCLVDDVATSAELHHKNSTALSTLLQKVTFIEESTRQLQEATGKVVLPMKDYNSAMSRLDLADPASANGVPSSMALTLTPELFDASDIYDGPRRASDPSSEQSTQLPLRRTSCANWCSCCCHTHSKSEFPWILKSFLGHIFVEQATNGLPCNEHACRRSTTSSLKLTYHLPRFLIRRYLNFAMYHNPLDGLNIFISLPRVMEWHHELFRYAVIGDIRAIQNLFSEGRASPYDVNPRGCNALIYAAAHGDPQLGRFLLQAGADPELTDSNGRKPIELFAERAFSGQFDSHNHHLVKDMLEGTTFVESRRFTPLHKIVLGLIHGDLEKELKVSTAAVNDCDAQGRTSLCWATVRDDRLSVETLLAYGTNPNIADDTGSTCLHFARSPEVCRALLDKHADIHARNRIYSRTPLHSFCKRDGTIAMIDQLVGAGLDVDARDADGETPLLNAIFRGFTAATEKLIELGADVNACNISSLESSIHFAVDFDRHEILPLLFQKGVDYTARNIRGRTIGHMAARVASARTFEVLSSFKLTSLDLSLEDSNGNTAADYLASRKIVGESDKGIHEAFAQLQRSCNPGREVAGPSRVEDLEGQELNESCQPPGAFPQLSGQQDPSIDQTWRDTVISFRCDYKSPCCYIFDAPRGVCSGVISYQSDGQVS
ncbi:MAG: hypothetical protein Q9216_004734 [Gyalolechia sp. 2 TL-2023]